MLQKKNKMSITPFVMDVEKAAAYLSLSESTFERLVREGELPKPRRFPNRRRVGWLRTELEEAALNLPVSDLLPPENTGARKPR